MASTEVTATGAPLDAAARIKQLFQQASAVDIDHNIPPKRYFRSGVELDRMARIYLDEDNLENAFILYTKFITLFVEKLPKHSQYNLATPKEKADTRKKLEKIFPIAEVLKRKLKDRYSAEYNEWKTKEEARLKEEEERQRRRQQEEDAERIRQRQKQDEEAKRQALAQPSIVPTLPQPTKGQIGEYPGAPQVPPSEVAPSAPPAAMVSDVVETVGVPSSVGVGDEMPTANARPAADTPPVYDRGTKPDAQLSRQDSSLIHGLRRVYVPHELIAKFLNLAVSNTKRNLETCGILTGKLARHVFHITHLIIPKQTATPDSCDTLNEEELFDIQDSHDLITLGWIHTHPSQTSFLSSVDLHTQYSYQQLMPEAIAIVCAPKYDQLGVYQLTPSHGLEFIGKCRKHGFHPHPKEPPLFQECEHVTIDSNMRLEVLDLR